MIYVTHDQIEAMTMVDKIGVLKDGMIEQVGSPHDLHHNPASQFVAGFIGSQDESGMNVRLNSSVVISVPVKPDNSLVGQPIALGIRPHDSLPPSKSDIVIDLELDLVERLGSVTHIYGSAGKSLSWQKRQSPSCSIDPATFALRPRRRTAICS
ncbi:ABC-type sugar transport system ATPase subunit [Bradyrhizobium sp. USDA 4341]